MNDNLKRNQFGGTVGGPVKKNRLFYFVGFQGTLIRGHARRRADSFRAFGNLGANSLVGPGYFEVDLALSRRFSVKEKQYVEIRAATFNIDNRVSFLTPSNPGLVGNASGSAPNSSNFGKILSDVSPRIMQFAVKYVF